MKKTWLLFLCIPWIAYGQMHMPREGRGPLRQRVIAEDTPPISLTEIMLFQYLQIHEIQRTYVQQVRQITLTTQTRGNTLRRSLAQYEKQFLDLSARENLSQEDQATMITILEEITRINRELFLLQREAMKKIEQLNAQREQQILSTTTRWIKKARSHPEELMKFVEFVQSQKNRLPPPPPIENAQNP